MLYFIQITASATMNLREKTEHKPRVITYNSKRVDKPYRIVQEQKTICTFIEQNALFHSNYGEYHHELRPRNRKYTGTSNQYFKKLTNRTRAENYLDIHRTKYCISFELQRVPP
ncbi:hypothetical protein HHI36_023740 [Cryptolaemus montrouzieri]|uniref:Uncharacterized protein n=1 Tax=Cryptolaemus montrouzieri TaxID=559131 RepID=A0ABD2PHG6_9CUCU